MEIYLIDRETKEIRSTYTNVKSWTANSVETINNGLRSKIYCDTETEYFTNVKEREVTND